MSLETLFKQLVRRLTFLFLTITSMIILIALVLFTYEEKPMIEELDHSNQSIIEWDFQKLIVDNPQVTDLKSIPGTGPKYSCFPALIHKVNTIKSLKTHRFFNVLY